MNLSQHTDLWKKIQAFPLDEPGAAITFSAKLSSQQNWSPSFTKRAIEEYRRFIFLCCISPTGASPSKVVDEVWHLHLTYTHSYWIKLCREVLGKDIHHMPSKGGDDENHKHEDWYNETLKFYKDVFGVRPPRDIWPLPATTFTGIEEPVVKIRAEIIILTVLIMLLPFVFVTWYYDKLNPYRLTGPQFLLFYFLLIVAALVSLVVLQIEKNKQLEEIVSTFFPGNVSAFEAAHFLNGKHRAVQTAIVDLVQRKLLEASDDGHFIIRKGNYRPLPTERNPFISNLLLQEEGSIIRYETITNSWYNKEELTHPALGRLVRFAMAGDGFLTKNAVVIFALLVGIIRIQQGIANERPVVFLVLNIIVLMLLAAIIGKQFSRKSFIIKRSRQLYNERITNHVDLKKNVIAQFAFSGNPVITGFAEGALLSSVFLTVVPNNASVYDYWGSPQAYTADGGSGSSCSSGSSCGSSCGGGCGGCGGGD
jgi:hypothetical protein